VKKMSESGTVAIIGGWIEAAGNILAAIGSTPSIPLSDEVKTELRLVGNALQAIGSVLTITADSPFN
jgi:hypothetical protein